MKTLLVLCSLLLLSVAKSHADEAPLAHKTFPHAATNDEVTYGPINQEIMQLFIEEGNLRGSLISQALRQIQLDEDRVTLGDYEVYLPVGFIPQALEDLVILESGTSGAPIHVATFLILVRAGYKSQSKIVGAIKGSYVQADPEMHEHSALEITLEKRVEFKY